MRDRIVSRVSWNANRAAARRFFGGDHSRKQCAFHVAGARRPHRYAADDDDHAGPRRVPSGRTLVANFRLRMSRPWRAAQRPHRHRVGRRRRDRGLARARSALALPNVALVGRALDAGRRGALVRVGQLGDRQSALRSFLLVSQRRAWSRRRGSAGDASLVVLRRARRRRSLALELVRAAGDFPVRAETRLACGWRCPTRPDLVWRHPLVSLVHALQAGGLFAARVSGAGDISGRDR